MGQLFFLQKFKKSVILFFKGMLMGAADIVPGVSGGTLAFIIGIYERLINAIAQVPTILKNIIKFKQLKQLGHLDWALFIPLGLGIVTSFVALSSLMTNLLQNHTAVTFAFFTGLILASAVILLTHTKTRKFSFFVYSIIAAIVAYVITGLTSTTFPNTSPVIFLSGFIAICAMLLPGVSGSYLLVVLGQYEFIINAIHERNIQTIVVFGIGAVLGLLTIAKVLQNLFKKFHDAMLFILTGVMIGALRVPMSQITQNAISWTFISIATIAGFVIVLLMQGIRRQMSLKNQNN